MDVQSVYSWMLWIWIERPWDLLIFVKVFRTDLFGFKLVVFRSRRSLRKSSYDNFKNCFLLLTFLYFTFLINFELIHHFRIFLVEGCYIKSNRERNYNPETTRNRSRAGLKKDYVDKETRPLRDDANWDYIKHGMPTNKT